jgi:hypothetical protein
MNDKEPVHGLTCPRCGGMVPIPEGQIIVRCPFCDLCSLVRGERGLQRYQVPQRIDRPRAVQALQGFLKGHMAIASDAAKTATLSESFLVYLPFWASWARVLAWIFGQERVQHNNRTEYRPKEIKIAQDMTWSGAACDVGEFGVTTIPLTDQALEAFNADALHTRGMVFEPVGSVSDAQSAAQQEFNERLSQASHLDRVSQTFVRSVRRRFGLVYYPLWVLRYLYRGRAFQVVVDGYTGQVLYGKAPGSTMYRAAMLVGGMALGAFLAVDISAGAFALASNSNDRGSGFLVFVGLVLIVSGFSMMLSSYRRFRYGEHYEFRRYRPRASPGLLDPRRLFSQMGDMQAWLNR